MLKLKNTSLKILMLILLIVVLLMPIASYATDSGLNIIVPGASPSPSPAPATTSSPAGVKSTPTVAATPTATTQTKLPQTGIEDYTGLIVVTIVLGASSIFAYKKIKDYKNF